MSVRCLAVCASLCGLLALASCNTSKAPAAEPSAAAAALATPSAESSTALTAPSAESPTARKAFGAPLAASQAVTLAEVLEAPEKFAEQTVQVEGEVRRACTRKGCWMELSEGQDPAAPGCRVTFKDYGFFVPTDSAGSKARVQAKVESKLVKPEVVAHMESEGGTFRDKAADGSAREVRLIATGVEIWR